MGNIVCRFVVIFGLLAWVLGSPAGAAPAKESASAGAHQLLDIGKPGPRAIRLDIRTDTPDGQPLKAGDSVVLHVNASHECYITAIYISAAGDAVILFPNTKTPDNRIEPEKEYTLFGGDSGIKLKVGDTMKEGRIVFFASPRPLNLSPLKPADGQACISIARGATEDVRVLKQKIEALAREKGFARKVLQLKAHGSKGTSLNLMGLPSTVRSDKPEGVTGVQGFKDEEAKH